MRRRNPGGRRQTFAPAWLLPCVTSTSSGPPEMQFCDLTMHSEVGVQQGDPMGSFYSCLAIIELPKTMKLELDVVYLDDTTLGDDAASLQPFR